MENKKVKTAQIIATVIAALLVIGLCLAGALLTKRGDTESIGSRLKNGFPLYFFGAFAIAGLSSIAKVIVRVVYRLKYCKYVTEAVCADLDCKYSHDSDSGGGSWVYTPVYEFEYNGKYYRVRNRSYSSKVFVADVGSMATIHVDLYDLDDYYIGNPLQGLISSVIVGLVFSVPALIILVLAVLSGLHVI